MSLGVEVSTGETPRSAGISSATGTAFFAGITDEGSATPTLIRSLNEYVLTYGPRSSTSSALYDAVNTFFALGGARCYVERVTDNSAVTATLTLVDSGTKPTILVSAKTPGVDGNNIKVEVVTVSAEYEINLFNLEGELIEGTGKLANQAAAIAYTSPYVTFTASSASEHTTNNPKTLAATALSGGANPSDLTDASFVASLANFTATLGPGLVAIPGKTSAAIHLGLAEHAKLNNRFAWGDLADSSTVATLISGKGSIATSLQSYIGYAASTAQIAPAVAGGTPRIVAASAVIAGLFAQVSATGNDNQAPAGRNWPLEPFVLGFTNTFSQGNMVTLNNAGINAFAERYGVLCLFGDRTAASKEADPIYYQFSASRERMHLVAEAEEIGERFMFSTLDGRHHTRAKFQGELQAMIKRHWEHDALYGETSQEAGKVEVGEPVNTPATEQAGQLNAELIVRISPTAEAVKLVITSTPITETV
jgi:hypothetical protein